MKKLVVLIITFALTSCSERTSETSHPDAIQVQVKNTDGTVYWTCMTISGGGAGNMAAPAILDMWLPKDDKCYIPKVSKIK